MKTREEPGTIERNAPRAGFPDRLPFHVPYRLFHARSIRRLQLQVTISRSNEEQIVNKFVIVRFAIRRCLIGAFAFAKWRVPEFISASSLGRTMVSSFPIAFPYPVLSLATFEVGRKCDAPPGDGPRCALQVENAGPFGGRC